MTKRETYISRQAKRLSKGQIDRRRFVMSALATGVTMPTALSLASRAEAAQPKQGGHLRFGVSRRGGMTQQKLLTGRRLTRLTKTGEVIPDLARSFDQKGDGLIWHLTFAKDNTPAAIASELGRVAGDLIAELQTGPGHLTLTLHHSDPAFDRRLARSEMALDLPEVGLYSAAPDAPHLFKRNFDRTPGDLGHFSTVELVVLEDERTRQNAILANEVDVLDRVDARALAMLASLPHLAVAESAGRRHFRLDTHDPNLREALRFGLDRDLLLQAALLGHGALGHDLPQRDLPEGAAKAVFDPDRARKILAGIGHETLPWPLMLSHTEGGDALLSVLNASLAQCGVVLANAATADAVMSVNVTDLNDTDPAPLQYQHALIPLWCNDLVVHSTTLAHDPRHLAPEDVALRWWFA